MEARTGRKKSVGSKEEAKTTERRRSARLNSSREQQQQQPEPQQQPGQQQQPEQQQQLEQQQQQQSLDNVATHTRLTRKRTCQNDAKSPTQSKNCNGETFTAEFGKKSRKKGNSSNQSSLPSQQSLSTELIVNDALRSDESKSNNIEFVSNAEGSNNEKISPPVNSDLLLSKSQLLTKSDSDDDLPEVLTPIDDRIAERDLVWVKYKNSIFWPALVLRLKFSGKKLQRLKVAFVEYENKELRNAPFYVRYNPDRIHPIAKNYQHHVIDGKQSRDSVRFKEAIEKIEKYIFCNEETRLDAFEFFRIESKKEEPENTGDGYSIYVSSHLTNTPSDDSVEISDDEDSAEAGDGDNEGMRLRNKSDEQYSEETRKCIEERCRKEEDLLKHIISSSSVKEHLQAVRLEQKYSTFQANFKKPHKTRSEQFAIVTQGFGPLRYESILVLKDYLLNFISELDGQSDRLDSMQYLKDVWIPEAIICGIQEHDGATRDKAEEIFRRGIKYTDEEMKRAADSLIANTTEADKEMHKNRSRLSRNSTSLCFL